MFNGDITDPRSFDDEILDSALAIAQSATGSGPDRPRHRARDRVRRADSGMKLVEAIDAAEKDPDGWFPVKGGTCEDSAARLPCGAAAAWWYRDMRFCNRHKKIIDEAQAIRAKALDKSEAPDVS